MAFILIMNSELRIMNQYMRDQETFIIHNSQFNLVIIQWESSTLKFCPVKVFRRHTVYFHGNAVINGTNEFAEIAANTFFFFHRVSVVRFAILKTNALM